MTEICRVGGMILAACFLAAAGTTSKADIIYGVSDSLDEIFSFDSSSPGGLLSAHALSGLDTGEQIRGIDWLNGTLYGLGDQSHLYTINPNTGAASLVGSGAFTPALNGVSFGFNGDSSQLYVESNLGQNITLNPNTGAATAGPNYTGATVEAMAYDSLNGNFYGLSAETGDLYGLNPATGATTLIGPSGITLSDELGFSISPGTGAAYFAGVVGGQSQLYDVNLSTGAFTALGALDPSELSTAGIDTIAVVPEPGTMGLLAVGGGLALRFWRRRQAN